MAGLVGSLGGLAGRTAGAASGAAASVAGGTAGFFGGMISPLIKFFNDFIKLRIAAADQAGLKREARDDKIVAICDVIWKEPIATETLTVKKEMPPSQTEEGNAPDTSSGAPLQIENSPPK